MNIITSVLLATAITFSSVNGHENVGRTVASPWIRPTPTYMRPGYPISSRLPTASTHGASAMAIGGFNSSSGVHQPAEVTALGVLVPSSWASTSARSSEFDEARDYGSPSVSSVRHSSTATATARPGRSVWPDESTFRTIIFVPHPTPDTAITYVCETNAQSPLTADVAKAAQLLIRTSIDGYHCKQERICNCCLEVSTFRTASIAICSDFGWHRYCREAVKDVEKLISKCQYNFNGVSRTGGFVMWGGDRDDGAKAMAIDRS